MPAPLSAPPCDARFVDVMQAFGPTSYTFEPPGFGYPHYHTGVDYAVPDKSPLYAVVDGVVFNNDNWSLPGSPRGYACHLISNLDGTRYTYGHVSEFLCPSGAPVLAGQRIALSGGAQGELGAGLSTGPHLHFEIKDHGILVDPHPLVLAVLANPSPPLFDSEGSMDLAPHPTGNRVDFVWRGGEDGVWHTWAATAEGLYGAEGRDNGHRIGDAGNTTKQAPAATWTADGKDFLVCLRGDDHRIYCNRFNVATNAWSGWLPMLPPIRAA